MKIKLADSDFDTIRCFPLMFQLRPHLTQQIFDEKVESQRQAGYRLVFIEDAGAVKAVAGFRILEMLAYGRFLYIDDLVTDETERSKGYGGGLFDWLVDYAKSQNCAELQLDSGVQRTLAHRFYFHKRMQISDFHFAIELDNKRCPNPEQ
jgi:GNAT superfamily N-acetyltransferase